ncbi:MAG: adenine phosphoribosyltransferase [Actinobacteria bacterium]|nr:adenine phosphoribosyltransferase [Actinomycetota bacterium]
MGQPLLTGLSERLLWDAIAVVPDFPEPGISFKDLSPLLGDPRAFATAIDEMTVALGRGSVSTVVGIEARGFPYAAALAYHMAAGFVTLRKPGKLPRDTYSVSYDLEYGTASLEMHCDAIAPGDTVVIIDDVLATGGTACAAVELVRRAGANIHAVAVILELGALGGRARLEQLGVPVMALLDADSQPAE